MEEFSRSAADLPNPLVRTPPIVSQPLEHAVNVLPTVMGRSVGVFIGQVQRVHKLAVDIELQLLVSSVANAHRTRILISGEMVQRNFIKLQSAIQPIHYLERPALGVVTQPIFQPFYKRFSFIDETQTDKSIKGESCVPQPRKAIIPIAYPTYALRQRECGRGDD